jgi:hypothetical protein
MCSEKRSGTHGEHMFLYSIILLLESLRRINLHSRPVVGILKLSLSLFRRNLLQQVSRNMYHLRSHSTDSELHLLDITPCSSLKVNGLHNIIFEKIGLFSRTMLAHSLHKISGKHLHHKIFEAFCLSSD